MHFLAYVVLCLIVGVLGANSRAGFKFYVLLSFFATPFVGLVLVFLGLPHPKKPLPSPPAPAAVTAGGDQEPHAPTSPVG